MPTSIDAAIFEAIAAIDDELNSDSSCDTSSTSNSSSNSSSFCCSCASCSDYDDNDNGSDVSNNKNKNPRLLDENKIDSDDITPTPTPSSTTRESPKLSKHEEPDVLLLSSPSNSNSKNGINNVNVNPNPNPNESHHPTTERPFTSLPPPSRNTNPVISITDGSSFFNTPHTITNKIIHHDQGEIPSSSPNRVNVNVNANVHTVQKDTQLIHSQHETQQRSMSQSQPMLNAFVTNNNHTNNNHSNEPQNPVFIQLRGLKDSDSDSEEDHSEEENSTNGSQQDDNDDSDEENSLQSSDESSNSDSDFDSEEESDESSFDDDENYLLPPPSFFKTNGAVQRSNSLPAELKNGEITTTQVSVLLNQMRMANATMAFANKARLSSSAPDERKLNLGRPSHFQGQAMDACMPNDPNTNTNTNKTTSGKTTSTLVFSRGTASNTATAHDDDNQDKPIDDPNTLYRRILEEQGYTYREFQQDEVDHFFHGVDSTRINSYSLEVVAAVKHCDIDTLRRMYHNEQQNMNCCNRFGESVLHAACRGGSTSVVRFLLEEAQVELRVRDDYGRTPMHDACWTAEPNMENILMIVKKWPDLMLVKDKRGFTPLKYVRKAQFPAWIDFLDRHHQMVIPKVLITSTTSPEMGPIDDDSIKSNVKTTTC